MWVATDVASAGADASVTIGRAGTVAEADLTGSTANCSRGVSLAADPRACSPTPADTGVIAAAGVAIGAVGIGATLAASATATVG